ncbi:hypothetical protein VP01_5902g1, partial [Puccinia sorghi]
EGFTKVYDMSVPYKQLSLLSIFTVLRQAANIMRPQLLGLAISCRELPPVGKWLETFRSGYEPIKFKRNLPIRGPSGSLIISGVFATCFYGFYRYGQGNVEKRSAEKRFLTPSLGTELKRENMWSRIHLVPILTAESDRDIFRRERAMVDREREIMKDDPSWVVGQSVYNTKFSSSPCCLKYVPTTIVPL